MAPRAVRYCQIQFMYDHIRLMRFACVSVKCMFMSSLLVNEKMHDKTIPLGTAILFMPQLNLISLFIISCTLGLIIYNNG